MLDLVGEQSEAAAGAADQRVGPRGHIGVVEATRDHQCLPPEREGAHGVGGAALAGDREPLKGRERGPPVAAALGRLAGVAQSRLGLLDPAKGDQHAAELHQQSFPSRGVEQVRVSVRERHGTPVVLRGLHIGP